MWKKRSLRTVKENGEWKSVEKKEREDYLDQGNRGNSGGRKGELREGIHSTSYY